MEKYFIRQKFGFNIGNFIMCTPVIKALSLYFNQKIKVSFEDGITAQLFKNCEFIEPIQTDYVNDSVFACECDGITQNRECVVNRIEGGVKTDRLTMLLSSATGGLDKPEWLHKWQLVENFLNIDLGSHLGTYVDAYPLPSTLVDNNYCVIVRGCAGPVNSLSLPSKDPGDKIYKSILHCLNNKIKIVFVGSTVDNERFIKRMDSWVGDTVTVLNSIEDTLAIINNAKFIITNDTGFYHAAGALQKDSFVLWKDTPLIKNQAPSSTCFFSRKGKWEDDFKEWIKNKI